MLLCLDSLKNCCYYRCMFREHPLPSLGKIEFLRFSKMFTLNFLPLFLEKFLYQPLLFKILRFTSVLASIICEIKFLLRLPYCFYWATSRTLFINIVRLSWFRFHYFLFAIEEVEIVLLHVIIGSYLLEGSTYDKLNFDLMLMG